jgi:hypothetical protein
VSITGKNIADLILASYIYSTAVPTQIGLVVLNPDGSNVSGGGGGGSAFGSISSGTNTTAGMVVGSGATLEPSGTGVIEATALASATTSVSVSAATAPTAGEVLTATSSTTATWQPSSGGSSAFSALTSGTNTTAAMLVGTGASLGVSGSGTIAATSVAVGGITGLGTGVATFLATPSSANLSAAVTGSTGTGALVFGTAPTLSNAVVGTQAALDNSTKAASTAYTDAAVAAGIAGVNPATAVLLATTQASDTSSLTYNNGVSGVGATFTGATNTALTFDGTTLTSVGQRVLVKNDTQAPSGAFNGIYYLTQLQTGLLPPILTRALDYDQPSDMNSTGTIPVISGTVNGGTSWLLTSNITTVGTSPLTFTQYSYSLATMLNTRLRSVGAGIGTPGSGSVPSTGVIQYIQAPYAGKITGYAVIGDQSGSAVIDIWKSNAAVPTVANTITASAKPTLSSSQYVNSTTLTGWTTAVAINDVIGFHLDSIATLNSVSIILFITTN